MGPGTGKHLSRDRSIVWVWSIDRDHPPDAHAFVKAMALYVDLLKIVPRLNIDTAQLFPTELQWRKADLVVFFALLPQFRKHHFDQMDAHLSRGGGLILIHAAMISQGANVAQRFGLAWDRDATVWGALPGPVTINTQANHEIFRGFPPQIDLPDELYWNQMGNLDEITVLATSQGGPTNAAEKPPRPDQLDGKSWPVFWTKEIGKGRVFGSFPGHNLFTFSDPYFRIILLRAMAWTMNEPFDPFRPVVTKDIKLAP